MIRFFLETNGFPISFIRWRFGDGNTSREAHPAYMYRRVGVYSVELEVVPDYSRISLPWLVQPDTLKLKKESLVRVDPSPDFNSDGLVDMSDFQLLVPFFGQRAAEESVNYDLDQDGWVEFDDLFLFSTAFGRRM